MYRKQMGGLSISRRWRREQLLFSLIPIVAVALSGSFSCYSLKMYSWSGVCTRDLKT